VVALGRRFTGKTWIGLLMAAFLFFVPQITVEVGSAIAGYADFPLSIFYLATIGCLFCATEPKNDAFFRLYATCLALLPWVKRDGLILDRKSTRLNSSHRTISYAVFCLKKKKK